jgi:hypothetical protein
MPANGQKSFASFLQKRRFFFFEKKKQKTFASLELVSLGSSQDRVAGGPANGTRGRL